MVPCWGAVFDDMYCDGFHAALGGGFGRGLATTIDRDLIIPHAGGLYRFTMGAAAGFVRRQVGLRAAPAAA